MASKNPNKVRTADTVSYQRLITPYLSVAQHKDVAGADVTI